MSQNYDHSELDIEDVMEGKAKKKCRRSSNHERVSHSATNVTCKLRNESNYCNSQVTIIHLPTEILEVILENLSYHEISKVREVCRRFRDVCIGILNRAFQNLKDCITHHVKILDEADAAYLKRFDPEILRRDTKMHRERKSGILICCRWLLDAIGTKLCLLRAVCYRFMFLNDIPTSICYPRCFFAGKIMDEVQRILTVVRSTRLTTKDMNVDVFFDLVNKFIYFFHDRIEPRLVRNEAVVNRATLFGSKVIDILDSCLNCKKNVNVSEDSQGWWHIKGEYKLFHRSFFTCLSSKQFEFQDVEPLTVKEQRILHECLFSIINLENEWILKIRQMRFKNVRPGMNGVRVPEGCYEGVAECGNSMFYYGYHVMGHSTGISVGFWGKVDSDNEDDDIIGENEMYGIDDQGRVCHIIDRREDIDDNANKAEPDWDTICPPLTFKVEMKCRKELAPLEVLLQQRNSSKEQHKNESSIEDTDHDLVLRLEINFPLAAMYQNRFPTEYRCVIKQKYLLEEPSPKTAMSKEDVSSPSDNNYNRSEMFTVQNSLRVGKLAL